jgi:hypothetical protein
MPLFSETPLTKRRQQFHEAVIYNRSLYLKFQLLSAIPFVIDQWEGMPVCIRRLDHIKELNEYQVRQFLCGYEIPVVGDLNEMKRCLAVGIGVSEKDAEDTFGYVYEVTRKRREKEEDEEGEKLEEEGYPESARLIHNFAYPKYSYLNEKVLFGEASFNNWEYQRTKILSPIPLLIAQPEGMPYYIQTLDDIKRLTEKEVKVFLRGYNQPIKGTLNELKRWLALMSYEDAVGAFGHVHYVKQYTEKTMKGKHLFCMMNA